MKKRWLSILTALALLCSLSACGGGSSSNTSAAAGEPQESPAAADMAYDDAKAESEEMGWVDYAAEDSGGAAANFSAVRQNAKLILSADLTLETQTFDQTCADLERLTAAAGGYIESSGSSGAPGERTANYTLRVPQEKFEDCFAQIGESCHVVSSNRWSEDVTEHYTDIETRLATLRTKHERLISLLDKASQMEDIISLENALADCEYEIDSLTGDKRRYDSLVGFSTISVCLRETQSLTAVSEGTGFGAQLAKAAKSGLTGLCDTVRGLLLLLVTLWPLVILAAALGVLAGKIYRKKHPKNDNKTGKTDVE